MLRVIKILQDSCPKTKQGGLRRFGDELHDCLGVFGLYEALYDIHHFDWIICKKPWLEVHKFAYDVRVGGGTLLSSMLLG